ncbi:magnesium/cobalt transporter CorA [Deltaproteobacteria bacterium TL4]
MARFHKKQEINQGLAPGSLVFIGEKQVKDIRIRVLDYDEMELRENFLNNVGDAVTFLKTDTVTWINIYGLHDINIIKEMGDAFDLHPLLLEDILNTGQRPKLEEFNNYVFITLKMLRYDQDTEMIIADQLSMVLSNTFLLTFQEKPADVFEPVRERIRKSRGRIRNSHTDYLAYALLDTVVDNYIYIIEKIGNQIEDLEDEVLNKPDVGVMHKINNLKMEMHFLRKSIRPAREAILKLSKLDSDLVHEQTQPFLKDLQDLVSQATESIDTYRDMLSDQLNLYNSAISNHMNDVMKVLTIFAAIFIPLTFITGVYGTNFEYLPELKYKYGYFIFWGVLIFVGSTMVAFFKRKGWL